ncbi:MAG: glycoside hydrolase clan [Microbacteriaceae bacterium]|nr:glycoside hydrolase clan [Microbacteriaceae bacterium]
MQRQWTFRTATSEYVVSLLADDSGLVLDHWGLPIPGGVPAWSEPQRFPQYRLHSDVAPLEYATGGSRQTAFSELLVDRGDSLMGATWVAEHAGVRFEQEAGSLSVPFADETGELRLTLSFVATPATDVVRRWMTLENLSADRTIELPRAFSAGWALPVGQRSRVHYLAGAWAQEFQPQQIDLSFGTFSIGSRQGVTSLAFSPVVAVESAVIGREGEAYGVALEWSGSWRLQVESSIVGDRMRVSCGIDDDTTTVVLLPGELFESPAALGVWSSFGVEGVSQAWQHYQRDALARSLDAAHRPVVYNSWMATEFDVRFDHQLRLARRARKLGVETFVVDDGWFVGRTSDRAGLGDWTPDPAKFPGGIGELADAVIAEGMEFGIWIEPEAVNPDSDLYRLHPEWVYRAGTRPLVFVRNQLVLDLGRPEVCDWVMQTLRSLLRSAPISYLKWDMNRPISDGGRPGDVHGRQWSLQHTRGYYDILRMLRAEFPHVTLEACAAGGGRIDNAVLALADVVWPSDETGPRDRLAIQHGYLSAYPAYAMSSWVTDDPGLRDRRATSLEFRFVVAMAGVLGIGADLLDWAEDRMGRAAELIVLYKSIRNVIHRGRSIRHGSPSDLTYSIEYATTNVSDPICVLVYDSDRDRVSDREQVRVRPTQLAESRRYRLRGTDIVVSAAEARSVGIVVPFGLAIDADVLILDPID